MKFQIVSFVASLAFITQVVAIPQDAARPLPTCVLHCGGPNDLKCPGGYRCCGPIFDGVGGTCFPGARGICPL